MSQSAGFVLSFYIALLVGWLVLNPLRIAMNAMYVMTVIESEDRNKSEGRGSRPSGYAALLDLLIVSEDAKEITRDMLATKDAFNKSSGDIEDPDYPYKK